MHGREELLAFLRSFMGAWSEYSNELEEIRVLPDGRLLVLFNEVGLGRSSGARTELHPGALVEIRDGLIVSLRGHGARRGAARGGPRVALGRPFDAAARAGSVPTSGCRRRVRLSGTNYLGGSLWICRGSARAS